MIRIWARIETDNKIQKDLMYESGENYNRDEFFLHLTEICYQLGIPTPVIIPSHLENFENFNNMRFLPRDFVEYVNFDHLVLENASR